VPSAGFRPDYRADATGIAEDRKGLAVPHRARGHKDDALPDLAMNR
jgi:hypothetical protein